MSYMTADQVVEQKHAMAGLAEIIHAYYQALRDEGFSRRDAKDFTMDYQREIVRSAQSD